MSKTAEPVEEHAVHLRVNGRELYRWTASPAQLVPLAVGRLCADGFVRDADDVIEADSIASAGHAATVHITLTEAALERGLAEREHRRSAGCGALHFVRCAPDALSGAGRAAPPEGGTIAPLFRALFDASERFSPGGGVHSAALSAGDGLRYAHHDVGRHNAVDKAVGAAILDAADRSALGLVLTARISADIALKAARGGLGWIGSRSVPTTLALEIAGSAGVSIIARAAGKRPRLYRAAAADGHRPHPVRR